MWCYHHTSCVLLTHTHTTLCLNTVTHDVMLDQPDIERKPNNHNYWITAMEFIVYFYSSISHFSCWWSCKVNETYLDMDYFCFGCRVSICKYSRFSQLSSCVSLYLDYRYMWNGRMTSGNKLLLKWNSKTQWNSDRCF